MVSERRRFLFIVQGEGRGHLTQALALKEHLTRAGHTVTGVLAGKSERRVIPDFVKERCEGLLATYVSPNLKIDRDDRGVSYLGTIVSGLLSTFTYLQSLRYIDRIVKQQQPDIIVNFYEILAGVYNLVFRPRIPMVCIGHQYLLEHPEIELPSGRRLDRVLLSLNTRMTSLAAAARLALSYREMNDVPEKKIIVMPPLLRQEVFGLVPQPGSSLLVYLVNPGYVRDIIHWHEQNMAIEMHVFCDQKEETIEHHQNLTFHRISDTKFLEHLRTCRGYVSTAGFESICEAMYLGKPFMAVPVANHLEQECNALDVTRTGAGISSRHFDFERFSKLVARFEHDSEPARQRMRNADSAYLELLEQIGRSAAEVQASLPIQQRG
jgi:uncharacterized protein (TIGR00661 family)